MKPENTVLDITIQDIEPIHGERRIGSIRPGISVIRGKNGSGKTTLGKLIRAATSTGRKIADGFAVVAGAARGFCRYGSRTLTIEPGGGIKRAGDAPQAVEVPAAFQSLNDPGVAGPQPRAETRLRSICEAFDIAPDADTLGQLLPALTDADGLPSPEWELISGAVDPVLAGFRRVPPPSVPAGARKLKDALQESRRQLEAQASEALLSAGVAADRVARAQAELEDDAGDELAEVAAATTISARQTLGARSRSAADQLARLRATFEAERRQQAEREVWQQQLAEMAVPKPGEAVAPRLESQRGAIAARIDQADSEIVALEKQLASIREERAALLAQLAEKNREIETHRQQMVAAAERAERAEALRQKLAAAAKPTVNQDDIDLAEAEVGKAARLCEYADRAVGVENLRDAERQATAALEEMRRRVGVVEGVDRGVWQRLGEILATRLPAGSARVHEGIVEAFHLGQWRDLDSPAFSEGQRWQLVLNWMIAGAKPDGAPVVVLENECPVDDDLLRALTPAARAKGLAIVVEKERAGAELAIEYLEGSTA